MDGFLLLLLISITSISFYIYFNTLRKNDLIVLKTRVLAPPQINNQLISSLLLKTDLTYNFKLYISKNNIQFIQQIDTLKWIKTNDTICIIIRKEDYYTKIQPTKLTSNYKQLFSDWKSIKIYGLFSNKHSFLAYKKVLSYQTKKSYNYIFLSIFLWAIGLAYIYLEKKLLN
jgi:hypothetical protein